MNPPVLGMILKGFPRISETFISNEILLLEQRGIRIHIFSMRHPREPFSHASVKKIKARVDYLPQTLLSSLPTLLKHNCRLALKRPANYGKALRVAFQRFLRTRKSATLKHLFQAGYLVNCLLPGSGVDHLHAHFAHSPSSVALFASCLSGLPFSFTAHAKDIYTSNQVQLHEKVGRAEFVVTCTQYNQDYLKQVAGGLTTPIHRIYHGIDIQLFAAKELVRTPSPPYRILTVARLTPKKGVPTILEAIKRLQESGIPIHHTLIGDGEDRARILNRIRELNLEGIITWQGTLSHEQVLAHYRQADLFVLGCQIASNGDRDGIPNVIVESMAMGVPVVATAVSAIPEIVIQEQTGLLVPPRAPDKMSQAIQRLLTDNQLRASIIRKAREQVRQGFDNHRLIDPLANLFLNRRGLN